MFDVSMFRPPPPRAPRCAKAIAETSNPVTINRRIMSVPPTAGHTAPHTVSAPRHGQEDAAQQLERLRRVLLLIGLETGVDFAERLGFEGGHLRAYGGVGVHHRLEFVIGLLLEQGGGNRAAGVGDLLGHGPGLRSRVAQNLGRFLFLILVQLELFIELLDLAQPLRARDAAGHSIAHAATHSSAAAAHTATAAAHPIAAHVAHASALAECQTGRQRAREQNSPEHEISFSPVRFKRLNHDFRNGASLSSGLTRWVHDREDYLRDSLRNESDSLRLCGFARATGFSDRSPAT